MKKNNQPFATFVNTKYIPLQKNHKLAGAAAVLILPLILFFFVLYLPKSKEIETLIQQKNTATQELQKARDTAATLNKHKAEMATIEEQFSETAVLFPKEMEIPRLLTDISAEGQSAGLEFLTFKPLAAVPKDFYSEIPISIKVNGPYHNMGSFLDHVSKLARIVSVSNVKMSAPKKSEGEMFLDSDCTLITYQFTNKQLAQPQAAKKK
ncbi:MAG: type 4a pilus biogenesis protein PilO [Desulfocapsaceae bacterium]|nr:type 4a pilus biogenesis protein PilO [Desulfocapsaceae bacterium]